MGICAEISKLAKVKFPKKLGTISFIPVGLVVSVFEIFLKKARKLRLVFARLCWPGGKSLLVAEVILLRQQLLLIRRKQKRAPALNNWDRFVFAFTTFFIKSSRLPNLSSSVAHSTLVGLHKALVQRKVLTSISGLKRKPGPRGPSPELIELIVEIQQKNPKYGCPRIAMLVSQLLRIKINVSLVQRI